MPVAQKVRPKIESDESVKELIRLVHGNVNKRKFIIREYQAYRLKRFRDDPEYQEYSVKSVDDKMSEISDYKTCPDDGPLFGRKCWYVKPEIMKKFFGDEQLPIPNQWSYVLQKEVKEKKPNVTEVAKAAPSESPIAHSKASNARTSPKPPINQSVAANPNKKRVQLLMSVPRGSKVDEEKKNNLISQYLSKSNTSSSKTKEKVEVNVDDEGTIEIID